MGSSRAPYPNLGSRTERSWDFGIGVSAGGMGIPLHWSLQAERRAVCFRLAPESPNEAGPQWSHPTEVDQALSASARFVTLPVRPAAGAREQPLVGVEEQEGGGQNRRGSYLRGVTTMLTAAAPEWELHGLQARVARRVTRLSRCASMNDAPA